MDAVVVREHALIGTGPLSNPSLDSATIPEAAFDWLCSESARLLKSGAPLVQLDDRRWLRLDNYVGVIETPSGVRIEILPKSHEHDSNVAASRRLLRTMLSRCLDLPARESRPASIDTFDAPTTEWVIAGFLDALDRLVKRGVRFDYQRVREERKFLRGRLDLARQLRQSPGRQHLLQIQHDVFHADRPENRLLKSAVERVLRITRDASNWQFARELESYLAPVPRSFNIAEEFRRWRDDRLMTHYRPVRPWCSLILNEETPLSLVGDWRGLSLLFPMERLFERYVGACLRRSLPNDARMTAGAASRHLCRHRDEDWFQLKPDFLVQRGERRWVLDTKWKRLDGSLANASDKYGLSQGDFYQLFAYGHRYLGGRGRLMLVYPLTATFREPLIDFVYEDGLLLSVVPFDLERGTLAIELDWLNAQEFSRSISN